VSSRCHSRAWAGSTACQRAHCHSRTSDTIAIAGQTVLGTSATFEARLVIEAAGGGSVYFE
jgi:hypothetical protein